MDSHVSPNVDCSLPIWKKTIEMYIEVVSFLWSLVAGKFWRTVKVTLENEML